MTLLLSSDRQEYLINVYLVFDITALQSLYIKTETNELKHRDVQTHKLMAVVIAEAG